MVSQTVRHNWATNTFTSLHLVAPRKVDSVYTLRSISFTLWCFSRKNMHVCKNVYCSICVIVKVEKKYNVLTRLWRRGQWGRDSEGICWEKDKRRSTVDGEQGVKQRGALGSEGDVMGSGSRGLRSWLLPCSVEERGFDLRRNKVWPWLHFWNWPRRLHYIFTVGFPIWKQRLEHKVPWRGDMTD